MGIRLCPAVWATGKVEPLTDTKNETWSRSLMADTVSKVPKRAKKSTLLNNIIFLEKDTQGNAIGNCEISLGRGFGVMLRGQKGSAALAVAIKLHQLC